MVSLNTSYLVIKVNVLVHFNLIAANLNKKTVSDSVCKDKLLKSKVNPLEYYYSYIPRTKLLFFYQYIPMSGLSQCKTGLLSQYICWCFSRRYHALCQVLLIHNVFMMVGFFSHSICELQWCSLHVLNKSGQLPAHTDT